MAENKIEPIILIDKLNKKEAHVVVNIYNTFEEIVEAARKINTGLFEGEWALTYVDPSTNKVKKLTKEEELCPYIDKEIYTFYWQRPSSFFKSKTHTQSSKTKRTVPPPPSSPYDTTGTQRNNASKSKYHQRKEQRLGGTVQAKKLDDSTVALRLVAYILDMLILGVIAMLAARLFRNPAIFPVVWFFYQVLFESSSYQATIGKMALGLKVTDTKESPISFGRASVRFIVKALSSLFWPIFFIAFFTEKKQAVHDLVAGTLVMSKEEE